MSHFDRNLQEGTDLTQLQSKCPGVGALKTTQRSLDARECSLALFRQPASSFQQHPSALALERESAAAQITGSQMRGMRNTPNRQLQLLILTSLSETHLVHLGRECNSHLQVMHLWGLRAYSSHSYLSGDPKTALS